MAIASQYWVGERSGSASGIGTEGSAVAFWREEENGAGEEEGEGDRCRLGCNEDDIR